jgi:16S rRNA (guanine(966)-N(2))-methyltransferase RsmD
MRVIAGSARGRRLKTLEGMDVRPTTDKVKEAIFSAIQFDLPDAAVLDLFAGSGQMGIEALSRGAASVVFVDRSARSLQVTRENLESVQFAEQAQLHQTEAQSFLQSTAMQSEPWLMVMRRSSRKPAGSGNCRSCCRKNSARLDPGMGCSSACPQHL